MRMAKFLMVGAAATLAVGVTVAPAAAAPSAGTTTTFTVSAGTLDITAPATANLGTGGAGTVITGQLGGVTVTDSRGAAVASWTASVVSTNFTTGGGTATETVLAADVDYWSGPATPPTTGTGTFTPGQVNAAAAAPLSTAVPLTAFSHVGGTGNNTAAWNPTLDVNVPLANQAGLYTGTVTHSVA